MSGPDPAAVGRVLDGKLRLVRQLGEGGMGTVFEALHLGLGTRYAVKVLHREFSKDPGILTRFHREARAAAAVAHETIVEVSDVGATPDGLHYIVMEHLAGESLRDRLASAERLEPAFAALVLCHVLSGLSAAHRAGIVHRDLKPENVFLVRNGGGPPGVKILDFGISRVRSRVADDGEPTNITATGVIMGTPEYMSPEQAAASKDVDQRTDIYSAGAILYECLTGRCPFEGSNVAHLFALLHGTEPPRPRDLVPGLPAGLEAVTLRAMAKRRELRYPSAAAMFDALVPFVDQGLVGRLPPPARDGGSPATAFEDGPTAEAFVGLPPTLVTSGAVAAARAAGLIVGDEETVASPTGPEARGAAPLTGELIDDAPTTVDLPDTVADGHLPALSGGRPKRAGVPLLLAGVGIGVGLSAAAVVVAFAVVGLPGGAERGASPLPAAVVAAPPRPGPAPPLNAAPVAPAASAPEPEPASPPADAEPPRVRVDLLGLPPGARVFVDGQPSALPLDLDPAREEVALRVEADGYEPFALTVRPDGVRQVEVQMVRRREKASTRPRRAAAAPAAPLPAKAPAEAQPRYAPRRYDLSSPR